MTDLRAVELRDATIAYLDEGPRDASAAVLIAGLGDDHTWWDALAHELLAVGYRVIRADNRGVGASSTVDVEHTTADMAGDILRVLDHAE